MITLTGCALSPPISAIVLALRGQELGLLTNFPALSNNPKFCYLLIAEADDMGRFEQIAKQVSQLPLDRQDVIADVIERALNENAKPWSVLTDEQAEIVRRRMEKPFGSDIATKEEVAAVFASKHE
jgi:hypothetical protein